MKKTMCGLALIITVASVFSVSSLLFASETDNRIESSARQSYVFRTYLKGDDIKIESRDGVAVLTGTVSGEAHKSLAQETVANLPGVTRVDNRLEEKGAPSAVYTDAWLIAKVKATLLFHRNLSAIETEVLAENGTVTLRGEATNMAQKDLVSEYVKDVDGVKAVHNEMQVSAAAMNSAAKTMDQKMDAVGDSIDDASVTAIVKTTLLYHRSTSALNTTVQTKDGVVKVAGKAKSGAEKDLVTKLVTDVHGVKTVVNDMAVEEMEPKTK